MEVFGMAATAPIVGGDELELTILMPCLNEESAISTCVREARQALDAAEIVGEVLVVDNGSVDRSVELAREAGARVVYEPQKGYGNAYLRGFKEVRGKYIVIGDSDGTYDFSLVPQFLELMRNGCDFVNGSRTKGDISPGAMPFLHRYVGVPILSWLLNRLSGVKFSDAHCGMRGFIREAIEKMELRTSGMELASEMILQAARANLRTAELPIPYRARKGTSKLHTFSDGWRHLRFMLLYSPTHLFAIPGAALLVVGLIILLALVWGRVEIGEISFDIHYMVVGSLLTLLGFQVLALGAYGRMHAFSIGILRDDPLIFWAKRHLTLERGLMVGLGIVAMGMGLLMWILATWVSGGFSFQSTGNLLRPALLGLILVLIGTQTIFSAFFTSLLAMKFDKCDEQQEIALVREPSGANR
jgi:glycosyltransferase involved in cell wall biosynthesis